MSYPSYPLYTHFNTNGYTFDNQNDCPSSWPAPTNNTYYQSDCYQPQPNWGYQNVEYSSPLYCQTFEEPPLGEFYQPQ